MIINYAWYFSLLILIWSVSLPTKNNTAWIINKFSTIMYQKLKEKVDQKNIDSTQSQDSQI